MGCPTSKLFPTDDRWEESKEYTMKYICILFFLSSFYASGLDIPNDKLQTYKEACLEELERVSGSRAFAESDPASYRVHEETCIKRLMREEGIPTSEVRQNQRSGPPNTRSQLIKNPKYDPNDSGKGSRYIPNPDYRAPTLVEDPRTPGRYIPSERLEREMAEESAKNTEIEKVSIAPNPETAPREITVEGRDIILELRRKEEGATAPSWSSQEISLPNLKWYSDGKGDTTLSVPKIKSQNNNDGEPNDEKRELNQRLANFLKENIIYPPRIRRLIRQGADPNAPVNYRGETPFMMSIKKKTGNGHLQGQIEIVGILIEEGADPNRATKFAKETPLMTAAKDGNLELVRLLISKGADPNLQDARGRTALMFAAENGHGPIVNHLTNNGAELFLKDYKDKMVWDYAHDCESLRHLERASAGSGADSPFSFTGMFSRREFTGWKKNWLQKAKCVLSDTMAQMGEQRDAGQDAAQVDQSGRRHISQEPVPPPPAHKRWLPTWLPTGSESRGR